MFSCSTPWSRMSEEEPGVPASYASGEHVERRACAPAAHVCSLLLWMHLEAFVDGGFPGVQGLVRVTFSCSSMEHVGLSNPTAKLMVRFQFAHLQFS